ncbi:hypothetical protein [Tepidibacter hydrothermalis]|uniref:Uncharacterized protein n=1 Tax=Tepidibacter hydrothermalis TaxID=3036126 RepID=A0ABY8EJ85_9FIRM|nr:hypothetical protein [Tepidibacter hydrothermalis]WFD12014.1 hypothetical protein P4S50_08025 [Tepidibacter hydrothermalis]
MNNNLQVTSMEDIKNSFMKVIELPGWDEKPFICKVKRVGILGLAQEGKIPNTLMSLATDMFNKKVDPESTDLNDMIAIFDVMAQETLVEPNYEDLKNASIKLTDQQLMELFSFSQQGVNGLKNFHHKSKDTDNNPNKSDVGGKTE